MGSSNVKENEYGSIVIQMLEITQVAGKQMSGSIHINMKKDFKQCRNLQFQLSGIEISRFRDHKLSKSDHRYKVKGKNRFLNIQQNIHNFQNNLCRKGQYTFPFTIMLPQWLPSSFIYNGPHKSHLRVKYKVVVCIHHIKDGSHVHTDKNLDTVFAKRIVIIRQPALNVGFNKVVQNEQDVTSMFFFKQGKTKAHFQIEKDAYCPLESLNLRGFIDNSQCDKDIEKVKLKLFRDVIGFSNNTQQKYCNSSVVCTRTYPGLGAKQKVENKELVLYLKEINTQDKYMEDYEKKKKKKISQEDKAMKELMLPSTRSKLVQCNYFLEIHLYHNAFFSQKMKPMVIPLCIYAPSLQSHQVYQEIPQPQNWQPQIFDQIGIQLGEQAINDQYSMFLVSGQESHLVQNSEFIEQYPQSQRYNTQVNINQIPMQQNDFSQAANKNLFRLDNYAPNPYLQQNNYQMPQQQQLPLMYQQQQPLMQEQQIGQYPVIMPPDHQPILQQVNSMPIKQDNPIVYKIDNDEEEKQKIVNPQDYDYFDPDEEAKKE